MQSSPTTYMCVLSHTPKDDTCNNSCRVEMSHVSYQYVLQTKTLTNVVASPLACQVFGQHVHCRFCGCVYRSCTVMTIVTALMYTYIYVYIHSYIYNIYIYIYIYMYMNIYIYRYIYIYTYKYIYTYMYDTYTYTRTHAHTHMHTHTWPLREEPADKKMYLNSPLIVSL